MNLLSTKKKFLIEKPVFKNHREFKKFYKYKNDIFIGYNRLYYKIIKNLKEK